MVAINKEKEALLTQEKLKELLHYNPDTGVFTWIIANNKRIKIGSVAGTMAHGYIIIVIDKRNYRAHRLAWLYMTGEWPKDKIDHLKHIRNDNRWIKLREATDTENNKNTTLQKNNTSGIVGVCWHKHSNKWCAQIWVSNDSINLGYYTDKFEAICARMSANNKYGFHENHGKVQAAI